MANALATANLTNAGKGRVKGVPNKATATLKEMARLYTPQALLALVQVVNDADNPAARVSAAKEILDRGYGKASTVLSGDEDGGPLRLLHRIEIVGFSDDGR